jgi:hypothetical protein
MLLLEAGHSAGRPPAVPVRASDIRAENATPVVSRGPRGPFVAGRRLRWLEVTGGSKPRNVNLERRREQQLVCVCGATGWRRNWCEHLERRGHGRGRVHRLHALPWGAELPRPRLARDDHDHRLDLAQSEFAFVPASGGRLSASAPTWEDAESSAAAEDEGRRACLCSLHALPRSAKVSRPDLLQRRGESGLEPARRDRSDLADLPGSSEDLPKPKKAGSLR